VKVAVAVTAAGVPRWQRDAIDALRALDGVDVRVVDTPGGPPPLRGLDARLAGPTLLQAPVVADGGDFSGCDVVVDFSAGAAACAGATHGVWSFRLGGNVMLRQAQHDIGGVPFAREVAGGAATARILLVCDKSGERTVLRSGDFPIPMWYPTLLRLALGEAARWPAALVAALRDGIALPSHALPAPAALRQKKPPYRAKLLAALGVRFVAGMRDAFFTVDQWNVGFAPGGPRTLLSGAPLDVTWLPEPPDREFVADPFVVERDGMRVLFLEDFNYVRNRGVIDAYVLNADNTIAKRTRVLESTTHLSYPYPLEIDGELYLMPENCAGNELVLYRCAEFPDRWERESVIFPDFDGVDTTLFEHGGRWWAYCTRYSTGPNLALHVYHADGPRGPWQPHPLNPVVIDASCARPAGPPFVVDGLLYRTGQDCSRTYGGAVVIARVDELTTTSYRESFVRRVEAPPGRYPDGFHTISFCGDMLVVDGKRTYRDPRNIGRAAAAFRGRIARALARRPSHRGSAA
jgi:hypothetical protein